MIASINGRIALKSPTALTVEVNGIGYRIFVPLSTFYRLPEEKEEVFLHIYTHVREDMLQLFGFSMPTEKSLFLLLLSVSGVGPKLALNILSGIGLLELIEAIREGEVKRLRAIPGVGPKMAGRLALELKDKIASLELENHGVAKAPTERGDALQEDALSALVNLGYQRPQAKRVIEQILKEEEGHSSVEILIRKGLKLLAKVK